MEELKIKIIRIIKIIKKVLNKKYFFILNNIVNLVSIY